MFQVPEKFRVTKGRLASDASYGNNGVFQIAMKSGHVLNVIASDGAGWEHVSVSSKSRTPTWEEMCEIKCVFWSDEDLVVQYHPIKGEYINCHPHCLHLWRYAGTNDFCLRPPPALIGF